MKVAIVHELLTIRGGAESVLRVFAEMFPDAPIYTLLYDEEKLGDWFPKERVRTSKLQKYAWMSTNHHLYLPYFPAAAEAWDFSEFDLVISSSSAFAHGIITNGKPLHLSYVHSPARYLWDRTHDVLEQADKGLLGAFKKMYLRKTFHKLRIWDAEAAERADAFLAASKTVQRRIELYWRKPSTVVTPPLDDFWFEKTEEKTKDEETPEEPYYLIASTLAEYKRIELAIEACNKEHIRLIVAGEGADKKRLQGMAGPTVSFAGYVTGPELKDLYQGAKATLFPGEEDFGLVPLESLACGTPVIAYGEGGSTETLTEGKTAVFFTEPTAASLLGAIRRFEKMSFDASACKATAKKYGKEHFKKAIEQQIDNLFKHSL